MVWTKRYEGAEPQRVNRWLAQADVCSRREAEALIAAGRVRIDGQPVSDVGRKIAPGQTLTLEGMASEAPLAAPSYVLNKPIGFVSAQPEPGQTPAARLLTSANLWSADGRAGAVAPSPRTSLAPLGRLDMDSRGLLLLSSDGVLAKAVIGPQSTLDKAYRVRVEGALNPEVVDRLRYGLRLDGRQLKRAEVERVGAHTLSFVLREGRNRQIRRMCAAVGLQVVDLLRLRIGPLQLDALPEGCWRMLEPQERAAILTNSR